MPNTTSSIAKRVAVKEYFRNTSGWVTAKDVANYLGSTVQLAKYYMKSLEDFGWLESTMINKVCSDNVARPTRHYRRARSVKRFAS